MPLGQGGGSWNNQQHAYFILWIQTLFKVTISFQFPSHQLNRSVYSWLQRFKQKRKTDKQWETVREKTNRRNKTYHNIQVLHG